MDNSNKNKILYYIGAGAVSTLILGGIYYLFNNKKGNRLSPWLEEYIGEIEELIKGSRNKEYSIEVVAHIYNLIAEIDDCLYLRDHCDLEEDRIASLDNEREYREIFAETMETRTRYYEKAVELVTKRFSVNLKELDAVWQTYLEDETKRRNLHNYKKLHYASDLPKVTKDAVKDAYVFYSAKREENEKFIQENMVIMRMNPDYEPRAIANIQLVKNRLKDTVKSKFGMEEKYLEQLVKLNNLQEDPQVRYYLEKFFSL